VIASLLYGVTATDPITYVAAGMLLLVVVGVLADFVPARRVANTDPLMALRAE